MRKELLKLLKNKNTLKFLKSFSLELVSAKFLKSLDAEYDRFNHTKKHSYDTQITGLSVDVYSETIPEFFTLKKDNKQYEIYVDVDEDGYDKNNYTFGFGKIALSVYILNNKKFISIRNNTFSKFYDISLKEFKELIYLANNPNLLNFL